ncbi:MAG: hypothetical protein ABIG45_06650 [Bacillota bacterium]
MKRNRSSAAALLLLMFLPFAVPAVFATGEDVTGLWQYREIVTEETRPDKIPGGEEDRGVLLSDLDAMPLDLLGKVFGKLAYTLEFTGDFRFEIAIAVLGMRFAAQGEWGVQDGGMTLLYDEITGFETLWWLGGFDHLTHCDAEHTMTETVAYTISDDTLTFVSQGAKLVFTKSNME